MSYENKVVIIHNLKDFDAGRTARHGTYNLQEKLDELDEVYRKAEAFNKVKKEIRKNASYLFTKTPSEERNAQIDILNGILIAMDDAEFDAENKEAD